ncbi:hypothetical protein DFJ77DRAFT_292806 [Powellomyces hirtus]|nr:hypothetical protein DFJ77DRAFT_292806 [Powellomyces hirtus]
MRCNCVIPKQNKRQGAKYAVMGRARSVLVCTSGIAAVIGYHFHRLHSIDRPPTAFRSLLTPGSTWGLYRRHLDVPARDLSSTVNALLNSRPYALELYLSGAPAFNAATTDMTREGSAVGNLVCEARPSDHEVVFRYKHADIDFRMYVAVPPTALEGGAPVHRDLLCGFVDYSKDFTQEIGSRVYLRFLTEATARYLEKA